MIDDKIKNLVSEEGTCLVLDKEAIKHNINFYKTFNAEVGASVKADGYGCGIENILPILLENGIISFFVHNVQEGIKIRQISNNSNIDIYILTPIITNKNIELIEQYNLIPIAYDVEVIKKYINHSSSYKKFGLHVETGINRNGIAFDDIDEVKTLIKNFEPEIMISHIGCTHQDIHYKKIHNELFEKFKNAIPNCKKYSLHASESVVLCKNVHDMLRIGIGLFGVAISEYTEGKLKNAVFIFSKVLQIKKIKKGEYVGYLANFVADKDMYIGTINFGYNDGLPRLNNNKVYAGFKGHKMPLLGVTSMDLAYFEMPNDLVEEIKEDPFIELFGNNIKIQDMCKSQGLHPLEILTRFGRYPVIIK